MKVVSITETSRNVWRLTFNGHVLGDSRGYAKASAIRDAREYVAMQNRWADEQNRPHEYKLDPMTTLKFSEVRAELYALGLAIGKKDGEYRVALYTSRMRTDEASAAYTTDLEDALGTGRAMAAHRDKEQTSIGRLEVLAAKLREIAGTVTGDYVAFWTDRAEQLEGWARLLRDGEEVDRTYMATAVREFAATAGVTIEAR